MSGAASLSPPDVSATPGKARTTPAACSPTHPTGSGAGREQFIAGHVDFAGSDSPLIADQIRPATKRCDGNPAWDLPLVFGPVALVYNLPGITTLTVNSDVLARILTGRIAVWNDPILAALNPGVAMPDTKITPIYRVDSSGTTDNLQKYLTAAAPESTVRRERRVADFLSWLICCPPDFSLLT